MNALGLQVTMALARKLGLEPPEEGAAKIRLTTYNVYVNGPQVSRALNPLVAHVAHAQLGCIRAHKCLCAGWSVGEAARAHACASHAHVRL